MVILGLLDITANYHASGVCHSLTGAGIYSHAVCTLIAIMRKYT